MADRERTPRALTIAGSDSGGGAGIQADLKAFARCGVFGTSAITAITAQNTLGVTAIHVVPPEVILAQVRAVVSDIGVDAVKIGMLGTTDTVRAVVAALDLLAPGTPVVVDPVMVAESGARLLDQDAGRALVDELLPRASVITPNLPEACALAQLGGSPAIAQLGGSPAIVELGGSPAIVELGGSPAIAEDPGGSLEALARALRDLGPSVVVITGGHREHASDLFFDGGEPIEIPGERHADGAAHGSGCTHSSVLAAQLALGRDPLTAARIARRLAGDAVASGLHDVGGGAGPVDVLPLSSFRSA